MGTHSRTKDLAAWTRQADVVVVAVGGEGILTTDMVSADTLIVNVGTTLDSQSPCLKPDVAADQEDGIVVTPTPGGVGSLCCAALFHNVVQAAAANVVDVQIRDGSAGCTADE